MLLRECWGNNGKDEKQGGEGDSDNCKAVTQDPRQAGCGDGRGPYRCCRPGPGKGLRWPDRQRK